MLSIPPSSKTKHSFGCKPFSEPHILIVWQTIIIPIHSIFRSIIYSALLIHVRVQNFYINIKISFNLNTLFLKLHYMYMYFKHRVLYLRGSFLLLPLFEKFDKYIFLMHTYRLFLPSFPRSRFTLWVLYRLLLSCRPDK